MGLGWGIIRTKLVRLPCLRAVYLTLAVKMDDELFLRLGIIILLKIA